MNIGIVTTSYNSVELVVHNLICNIQIRSRMRIRCKTVNWSAKLN
jgi:hypothetical protein